MKDRHKVRLVIPQVCRMKEEGKKEHDLGNKRQVNKILDVKFNVT